MAPLNVCKALCELSGVQAPWNSDPYGRGLRRCRRCDMFFETTSRSCPCCGTLLRTRPRTGRARREAAAAAVATEAAAAGAAAGPNGGAASA